MLQRDICQFVCMLGLTACFLILPETAPARAETADFTDFYSVAEGTILNPPELDSLSVLCSKKAPKAGYYSFVGGPDGKVLLVVFTQERVKDLSKVISLKVLFYASPSGISPMARPIPEGSWDWMYIYDRNKDGQVDYHAYLYAALPFKPDNFPRDFPKMRDGKWEIEPKGPDAKKFLRLFFSEARMIFSHHADDNFDGATDAVIASVHDSFRPIWVEEFGVLRSTRFDGKIDDNWTFRHDIHKRTGNVPISKGQVLLQNDQPPANRRTGEEWLAFGDRTMGMINRFAKECGLGRGDFRP